MSTKHLCDSSKCTGCFACLAACPKQAISVKKGFLGEILPVVDNGKCVDCGLCDNICPSLNSPDKKYPIRCFAAWTSDNADYLTTTSGGVATAMAKAMVLSGGVVYGCTAFGIEVKHIRCTTLEDVESLKGSKYVQSDTQCIYKELKNDVAAGKNVLFIGTPCQCAGVKGFLRKDYANLLLVDLICHGVPSSDFLHKCLKRNFPKIDLEKIDGIRFRENSKWMYVLNFSSESKKYRLVLNPSNIYFQTFFYGNSFRNSCYTCQFARPERCSYITIGAFWGLKDLDIAGMAKNGISCILVNTGKGHSFIERLGNITKYEQPIEDAVCGNAQLQAPTSMTVRTRFFRHWSKYLSVWLVYRVVWMDKIFVSALKQNIKRILKWQK